MDINYLAVIAAALSTFLIGGLWYSPFMFHKAWAAANGLTEADLEGGEGRIFGIAYIAINGGTRLESSSPASCCQPRVGSGPWASRWPSKEIVSSPSAGAVSG